MNHFCADIRGHRGMATKTGTKSSGMRSHIRGQNLGVYVECQHNPVTGKDVIEVYKTGGSNGIGAQGLLARIEES